MATIDSVKLPDNSTYDLTDNYSGYQKQTLTTPITINGTQETTVEDALSGLNDYGDALADNLAANENVYGAKNQLDDSNCTLNNMTQSGHTFTSNTTDTRSFFDFAILAYEGTTPLTGLGGAPISVPNTYEFRITIPNNANALSIKHNGAQADIGIFVNINVTGAWVLSIDITGVDPTTVGGLSFKNIMLRPASIIDPTFAPFAETNLQLTRKTSGLSNENLIDNPFFTVNQRGFVSVATNANRYIIDRWVVSNYTDANGICSLSSSGLTFDNSASAGETELMQKHEHSLDTTKQYTASIKLSNGTIYTASGSLPITVTIPSVGTVNATDTRFKIVISGGASAVTIRDVKLELGSVSTLANDVEPNYTTELLKCQRYFERVKLLGNGNSQSVIGIGYAVSATVARITIFAKAKRDIPTITTSGTLTLHDGSSVTALSYEEMTDTGIVVNATSSGLTSGNVYLLRLSDTSYYIDFASDL